MAVTRRLTLTTAPMAPLFNEQPGLPVPENRKRGDTHRSACEWRTDATIAERMGPIQSRSAGDRRDARDDVQADHERPQLATRYGAP